MNDTDYWAIYGNALSVYDPSGTTIGAQAANPTIYSSNTTCTIPTLLSSNMTVYGPMTVHNGVTSLNAGVNVNGTTNINGALSTTANNTITSGLDVSVARKARIATNWDSASRLAIEHPGTWDNAEWNSNAFVAADSRFNGGQFLFCGADSANSASYVSSTGNGSFRPLVLQGKGGGVGIGRIPTAGFGLDVNGSVNVSGNLNSSITTYSSNIATSALSTGANALNTATIALDTANNALNTLRVDMSTERFLMYFNASPFNGSYPIGDGVKTIPTGLPTPVFCDSFATDAGLTRARMVLRAQGGDTGQIFPGGTDCWFTIMRCSSLSWDWTPLLTATGTHARVYVNTKRFANGGTSGASDWFVWPPGYTGPMWIGLHVNTNNTMTTTYGIFYINSYIEVK